MIFRNYAVRADPGNIGGSLSHEYHVTTAVGEDTVVTCLRSVRKLYML